MWYVSEGGLKLLSILFYWLFYVPILMSQDNFCDNIISVVLKYM